MLQGTKELELLVTGKLHKHEKQPVKNGYQSGLELSKILSKNLKLADAVRNSLEDQGQGHIGQIYNQRK